MEIKFDGAKLKESLDKYSEEVRKFMVPGGILLSCRALTSEQARNLLAEWARREKKAGA